MSVSGPPEKKRKTDDNEELWGDEDDESILSQVLECTESGGLPTGGHSTTVDAQGGNVFRTPLPRVNREPQNGWSSSWPESGHAASSKQINQLKEENGKLKSELQKKTDDHFKNVGQIKMLRTKLAEVEKERFKMRESLAKERTEKEKRAIQERDQLETQARFLEKEKQDQAAVMSNLKKQMAAKEDLISSLQRQMAAQTLSPEKSSPSKRPKYRRENRPSSPHTSTSPLTTHKENNDNQSTKSSRQNLFPTQETFRAAVGPGGDTAGQLPGSTTSPSSPEVDDNLDPEDSPRVLLCDLPKGTIIGPRLVHKMMRESVSAAAPPGAPSDIFTLLSKSVSRGGVNDVNTSFDLKTVQQKKVVPLLSKQSSDMFKFTHVVSPQTLKDCRKALACMLTDDLREEPTRVCQETAVIHQGLMLLPVLQGHIVIQLESMQLVDKSGSSSSSSASVNNGSASVGSVGSVSASDGWEDVTCALDLLQALCCSSCVLAQAVLYGTGESGAAVSDTPQQMYLAKLGRNGQDIVGRIALLKHLMTLVEPLSSKNKVGSVVFTSQALDILCSVARSAPRCQLKRFLPLISSNKLGKCLEMLESLDEELHTLLNATVSLLSILFTSADVLTAACNGTGNCLAFQVSRICSAAFERMLPLAQKICVNQLYQLFAAVLTTSDKKDLSSDCPCSNEMTNCVVVSVAYYLHNCTCYKQQHRSDEQVDNFSAVTAIIIQGLRLLISLQHEVLSSQLYPRHKHQRTSVLFDSLNFLRKHPHDFTDEINQTLNVLWLKYHNEHIPEAQ